eukprot:2499432-Amphidinium_carterae.1
MCEWQAAFRKPTQLASSLRSLGSLSRRCTHGQGAHASLTGAVLLADGRRVWRTRLAQVYPPLFCRAFATCLTSSLADACKPSPIVTLGARLTSSSDQGRLPSSSDRLTSSSAHSMLPSCSDGLPLASDRLKLPSSLECSGLPSSSDCLRLPSSSDCLRLQSSSDRS